MAGFNAHLTSGAVTGTGLGLIGLTTGYLRTTETIAIAIIGTIGGLLPDIDSDTGKPLQLLFQLISVMIPVFLYPYFLEYFTDGVPFSICYFSMFYLFINYVVCPFIKKLTAHRGVMHSIPFAILCGEIAYLSLLKSSDSFALFGSLAIFLGSITHLTLDEFHSLKFTKGIIPTFKRSSGTALTFTAPDFVSISTVYLLMISFGAFIIMQFYEIPVLSELYNQI